MAKNKDFILRNIEIRNLYLAGEPTYKLIKRFKISKGRIHQILTGYSSLKDKKIRKEIFKRDKNKCQLYDHEAEKRPLIIHHVDKNSHNNNYNNLVSLCYECHKKVHSLLDDNEE